MFYKLPTCSDTFLFGMSFVKLECWFLVLIQSISLTHRGWSKNDKVLWSFSQRFSYYQVVMHLSSYHMRCYVKPWSIITTLQLTFMYSRTALT